MRSDVIVIGGGPAGSAAAIALAQIGMQVRLYEKARFPRHKLCGGFLSPESLDDLKHLGVLEAVEEAGGIAIRRSRVTACSGAEAEASLPAAGLSLSRMKLDQILLERAAQSGVDIHQGIDGTGHTGEARWEVIAHGRSHAPAWGEGKPYYGLQSVFEGVPGVTDQVELHLVPGGYVGLVRQEGGWVNLCALTTRDILRKTAGSPDAILETWRTQNPGLDSVLRASRCAGSWHSTGPVIMGIRQLSAARQLFAGDAACVVDPFAGEGVAMALHSATLLQQAFIQKNLAVEVAYEQSWRRTFQPALRFHRWTRHWLSRPALQETLMLGLRVFPPLLSWLTSVTRPEMHGNLQPYPDRSAI